MSGQLVYTDPGATDYQQLHRTRELKHCVDARANSGSSWSIKLPARS